jgi:hypothetical protein
MTGHIADDRRPHQQQQHRMRLAGGERARGRFSSDKRGSEERAYDEYVQWEQRLSEKDAVREREEERV